MEGGGSVSDPNRGEQSTPERPARARWGLHPAFVGVLVFVGVLAAVGLGFLLGRSTVTEETPTTLPEAAPTTQPVPPTTEPAPLEPSASGPALAWEPTDAEISAQYVAGIVEFQGRFLAYASDSGTSGRPSGVSLWSSVDGRVWSGEGVVIPAPAVVESVFASDDRILALGRLSEGDIAGPFGTSASTPAAWTSTDGTTWQQHELLVRTEFEQQEVYFRAGATTSEVGIAVVYVELSIELAVMEALPPDVRELWSQPGVGSSMGWPPGSVQIPLLGITVYSATFEELGIDPELAREAFMGGGMRLWTTTDFQTWSLSDSQPFGPEGSVDRLVVGPEGDLVAFGYGRRGAMLWRSDDGVTWAGTPAGAELSALAVRGDAFISAQSTESGASVVRSRDGETWDPITPDDLLSADFMWHIHSVSAADYGMVASATGHSEEDFMMENGPPVAVISKDGMTVISDEMRRTVTVSRGGEVLLEVPLNEESVPEGVTYDFVTSTLTFADPVSGQVLITLTLEEILQAEQERFGDMPQEETVILFSQDETSWSVQSIGEAFGVEQGLFPRLFAFDDFVLAAVREFDPRAGFDPEYVTPPTRIWMGTLP